MTFLMERIVEYNALGDNYGFTKCPGITKKACCVELRFQRMVSRINEKGYSAN